MRHHQSVTVLLLLMSTQGSAQQAASPEQETIQELVQQLKELQNRVKELESHQPIASSTQSAPAQMADSRPPAPEETSNTQLPFLPQELHELRGIQWRGFGEVNYKVLNQRTPELGSYGFVPGSHGNFFTGDFDLLLTSRINDKASVLAEVVIGEADAQRFEVDLGRVLFKYDYNDHLKMSFGRYHTGIGYYNTAFHNGGWLQTTADRPLIMEFADDGGPLPTQAVGVSVTGLIPSGGLGLNYLAEYGSSDTIRLDLLDGDIEDESNSNHFDLGVFARPNILPGLQVGGSFYHDEIQDSLRGGVKIGQTILNAHVVYLGHGIEFLNEGFLIRHAYEQSSTVFNMPAFYSQVSKRFGRVRPFLRYQYINANPGGFLEDIGLRHGPSFGARYDFDDNIGFKAQFDHTLRRDLPDLNGLHLQLAFTF